MARSRRSEPPPSPPPAVTVDRAARLCRLVSLLGEKPQTRAGLLRRLKLDVRGFYRDLQMLRQSGIGVVLEAHCYVLTEPLADALANLPFPDPRLTLGEECRLPPTVDRSGAPPQALAPPRPGPATLPVPAALIFTR